MQVVGISAQYQSDGTIELFQLESKAVDGPIIGSTKIGVIDLAAEKAANIIGRMFDFKQKGI